MPESEVSKKIVDDLNNISGVAQICIGGILGWATGYLTTRCGKVVTLFTGVCFIGFLVAAHQEYIPVDGSLVREFGRDYSFLVASYTAGVLIGNATSP